MDNPTTLLVAIMYVTIVSIGLGNLLMFLSELVKKETDVDGIHLAWTLLLPLIYFVLFWQTTSILEVEGWTLPSFIGFMLGPIFMLMATNLLLELPSSEEDTGVHYAKLRGRFFLMFGLFNLWLVGLDLATGHLNLQTFAAGALTATCFGLMFTDSTRIHQLGVLAGALLSLVSLLN